MFLKQFGVVAHVEHRPRRIERVFADVELAATRCIEDIGKHAADGLRIARRIAQLAWRCRAVKFDLLRAGQLASEGDGERLAVVRVHGDEIRRRRAEELARFGRRLDVSHRSAHHLLQVATIQRR